MSTRPPRIIEWTLLLVLDAASREAVIGDLTEEYSQRRATRGRLAAGLWYAREAARSIVACRVTGRRRSDERRLDFEPGPRVSLVDLLRPALRQFRDHPLYAIACSGTLAVALAAACASFAVVKRALFDPLPYARDEELVSILTVNQGPLSAVSPHVLEDLRASAPPLRGFAPIRPASVAYAGADGMQPIGANLVTPEYFALLGIRPVVGRVFHVGERDAVVVSWSFWQQSLAGDAGVVGRVLLIDGTPRTVAGILPREFVPPYWPATAVWLPFDPTALLAEPRGRRTLSILARRAEGASPDDVERHMARFSSELRLKHPVLHGQQSWAAIPLRHELVGDARSALIGTAAGALLLLVIVGANIAGLSAAHALAMQRQLAIRAALGATRRRLFVEQLVDSLVLAAVGSAAGLWLAGALVRVAARYQQQFLERLAPVELDPPTLAAGLAAGLTVGMAAALLPRRVVDATRPLDTLLVTRSHGPDLRVTSLRTSLVVAQVALALVLLVQAGLLVRTVQYLGGMPLGFTSEGLTTVRVALRGARYETPEAQIGFERQVLDRLRLVAGVSSASASVGVPVIGGMGAALVIKSQAPGGSPHEIAYFSVSPEFMPTIGARLVAGRGLDTNDDLRSPPVVVINETMARTFWPRGDALGAEVQIGTGASDQPWLRVVGVYADLRQHGPTEPVRPTAFGSTRQFTWPQRFFIVRTAETGSPFLAADLRAAVHAVDSSLAVGAVTPVPQLIADRTARHGLVTLALVLFGGVALVLCLSGLYAIVALTSRLRRREYAIRLALGARRGTVRWMVLRQGLILAGLGTLLGLAAAALGARTLQALLHGVPPVDAATFGSAAAALLLLATLAALHPARRAERVDPVETLKAE